MQDTELQRTKNQAVYLHIVYYYNIKDYKQ